MGETESATNSVAAATSAFAIPLGIIALALAEIVGLYEIFQQKVKNAALAFELANNRIENQFKQNDFLKDDIKNKGDIAVAQLEATGASQEKIRDAQYRTLSRLLGVSINEYNVAFANFTTQLDALRAKYGEDFGTDNFKAESFFSRIIGINKGEGIGGKISFAFEKVFNGAPSKEELDNFNKAQDLMLQKKKDNDSASKALDVKTAEQKRQQTLDGLKDYVASLDARLNKLRASGDQEKIIELEKEKNIADAKAQAWGQSAAVQNQIFADADEKNRKLDLQLTTYKIENAEAVAQKELALAEKGSFEEYAAKAKLIDLNAKKEIAAAQGNQVKISAIKAQARKAQNDLTDQTNEAEIEREKEIAVLGIQARLDAAQKGSKEELSLQIDLMSQKERYDAAYAQVSIKNADLREATLTEIHSKALSDREKAESAYYENVYKIQVQAIRNQTSANALPFQAIQNNPLSTPVQKDQAAISETQQQQLGKQKELETAISAWTAAVSRGDKEAIKYKQDIDKINLTLEALKGHLANQIDQKTLDRANEMSGKIMTISQGFSSLSSSIASANPGLAEMANTLSGVAGDVNNIYLAFSKTLTSTEALQAGISGVVQLVGLVLTASAARHQAESQFNADILQQQDAYNAALNQSILLNYQLKDNIFTTDYKNQIDSGLNALTDASDKYQDSLKKLVDAQVIAGKQKAINWKNVLGGAGAGAAVGSQIGASIGTVVLPVIGTAAGAVVGAVVGGIAGGLAGLFGGKKSKDVLAPILQQFPQLLDDTKTGVDKFNASLAKSIIDANLVKGASKETLESLIQWQEAVHAANKQIEDAVSSLAGQLGDNLRDSLVQAFEDGTDAGQAFAKSVGDSLESVIKQLLFNQVFGGALKDLQDKLTSTLENGGDVEDTFANFFATYSDLANKFDTDLSAAQAAAKSKGLDIFQGTNNTNSQNSLSGAIKAGITEDTATLLAGSANAMRLAQIQLVELSKASNISLAQQTALMTANLNYIIKIESNTGLTAKYSANLIDMTKALKSIDSKISNSDATKRAGGIP